LADRQIAQILGIQELANRWSVSRSTVERLIDTGELETISIMSRRMVPLREVKRIEKHGAGKARPRAKLEAKEMPC
jgi:excisionase family DNA binding protein